MKKTKSSNPVRLIAFFLTALILVCTFGFTADGWQIGADADEGENKDYTDLPSDNSQNEENKSGDDKPREEPEIYIPCYVNRLTGRELQESEKEIIHLGFVMNADIPCYGISGADLVCELPTEDGTRYIAFIPSNQDLWKSGSIVPTRGYISNLIKYFGGICISYGNDDSIKYDRCDTSGMQLDLTASDKYHYTEFMSNVYTNSDLLDSALKDFTFNLDFKEQPSPFSFTDYGAEPIVYGDKYVSKIKISHTASSSNEIIFNDDSSGYTIIKNDLPLSDAINGKIAEFENCFILFSDSVIYDNATCSQMVMDTIGSGSGYYFSAGGICEINWSATAEGKISFITSDGAILTVNRGRSYISFLRSSMREKLSFE